MVVAIRPGEHQALGDERGPGGGGVRAEGVESGRESEEGSPSPPKKYPLA